MATYKYKLALVVATYNREDVLAIALGSLANQTAADYQVIIVDNNSTDSTAQISAEFVEQFPNFSYFVEQNQGLSFSRNRGFAEAEAAYVGYIDDDAKVDANYVKKCLEVIETYAPDMFGGPIYPFYLEQKPDWFKDEYEIRKHYEQTGWASNNKGLSGSNMIFKTTLLQEFKGFNTDLGMKGNQTALGEDTEFIRRAYAAGKNIYYDLDLIVQHLVPKYKMNLLAFMVRRFTAGRSFHAISKELGTKKNLKTESELLAAFARDLDQIFTAAEFEFEIIRKSNPELTPEQMLIEKVFGPFYGLGQSLAEYQEIIGRRNLVNQVLDFSPRKLLKLLSRKLKK
jgi:glycosyltransferase involved in cell wall biosynthesis